MSEQCIGRGRRGRRGEEDREGERRGRGERGREREGGRDSERERERGELHPYALLPIVYTQCQFVLAPVQ